MPLKFDPSTHTYTDRGVVIPSVTQVLKGVGLINFGGIDPRTLEQAALFGTSAHQACHYDDLGELDEQSLDPNLKPYLEAWRAFRGDMEFYEIEQPLFSETYKFAGTPDRVGRMTIIDIKTGSTIPAWTGLQLAAYSILANITTARRLAVQLKGDGTFKIHEFKDRDDRKIFLSALSVYQWGRNHDTNSS